RKRFFDANVVDRLAIARGAPPAFAEAAERALDALARLAEGRLALSGSSATLSGAARYDAARHDIERAFPDMMPQSFRGEAQLSSRAVGSPLDAVRCQAALADLVAKSPIRFGSDDSSLAPESVALVDAIAATALRCQNAIEIGAYTDNRGIDEINVARSKRRAQALADALIRAGVDPFRVTSVGYGAERPVASNDNDENRARNNRVEFVVK
ncbi:MAG: OmpA family protein, partial [Methylocystis sp.]|nr:OmpA family protein [Methylocystis sp.]